MLFNSCTQKGCQNSEIAGHEGHHRVVPFVEELKRLLEENGVAYDPKYLL